MPTRSSKSKDKKLSTGQIVVIVIVSVFGFAVLILCIYLFVKWINNRADRNDRINIADDMQKTNFHSQETKKQHHQLIRRRNPPEFKSEEYTRCLELGRQLDSNTTRKQEFKNLNQNMSPQELVSHSKYGHLLNEAAHIMDEMYHLNCQHY